jgi:hypothetical protein
MAKEAFKVDKEDADSLTQRYLFWLYKTTRDQTDKIDRKFTQLEVDREIQMILARKVRSLKTAGQKKIFPFLEEWKEYIFAKESDAQKLKFSKEGGLAHQYLFLRLKLTAITQIIKERFGLKTLKRFKALYEEAAFKAISQDTSGRR